MMEILMFILQNSDTFDQTSLIDLSSMGKWNFDVSDKADSNWNRPF